jgi:hypothetical protein
MKKIKLLVFSLALFLSSSVHTEDITAPFEFFCGNLEQFKELVKKSNETPVFTGHSIRKGPNGEIVPVEFIMLYNHEEKTYTVVERMGKDVLCVISFGRATFLVPGTKI